MIKGCLQGIRRNTVLVIIFVILAVLILSLNYYGYYITYPLYSSSSSDGIAFRGFPFPILQSESWIYVGNNGRFAEEVGVKYILEATGKEGEFDFSFPGFIANLLFYGVIGSFFIVLDAHKDSLIDKVKITFDNKGVLIGVIKMLHLGLFGVVVLFTLLVIFGSLFFFILDTLGIMW